MEEKGKKMETIYRVSRSRRRKTRKIACTAQKIWKAGLWGIKQIRLLPCSIDRSPTILSWGKLTIAHHVRPLLFRECPVYNFTCRCQLHDLGSRLLLREDKEQIDSTDLTP